MAPGPNEDKSDTGGSRENGSPTFDIFRGPPRHVERVGSALETYLEKVRDMRVAKANLLSRIADMFPKNWKILPELKVYLEDQSMLWGLAVSDLRPIFNTLKKYSALIDNAKFTVGEFESRLMEVHKMKAEYEMMKKSSNVSKSQQIQIEFMLRESSRALSAIRVRVEEILLGFRRSQTELGREILQKFEGAQKVTCEESIQVIDMIDDRLSAVPAKKLNRDGQPIEDLEFVHNLVQSIIDRIEANPADLSAKIEMYNQPRSDTGNQLFNDPRPVGSGQGQYSGYQQGHGQAQRSYGGTVRSYSGSNTSQEHRASRVSRPKTPTAGKDVYDSTTSLYSWNTGSATSQGSSHSSVHGTYSQSSRNNLRGATPYNSSKSNVIRHVQAPGSSSGFVVCEERTTCPAARQGQGRSSRSSSRPSSPASQQGESRSSGRQQKAGQSGSGTGTQGCRTIGSERSMEDLYSYCKPAKPKTVDRTTHKKSRIPFKIAAFPASSADDVDNDFYDCQ